MELYALLVPILDLLWVPIFNFMKDSLISQILDPKDIYYCILEILLSIFIVNSESTQLWCCCCSLLEICLIKLHVDLYNASLLLMSVLVLVI